jgi:hypothetical protein
VVQSNEDTLPTGITHRGSALGIVAAGLADALRMTAGLPDDTVSGRTQHNNYAIQIEGPIATYTREASARTRTEPAIYIHGKRGSMALSMLTDSAEATINVSGGVNGIALAMNGGSDGGNVIELVGVDTGIFINTTDADIVGDTLDMAIELVDISALALQTEVQNLNGWNPLTDSVNVDGSAFALIEWAQHMYVFLGWGEIGGLPVWSQDRPNANVDTLFVGFHLSGGPPTIDTVAAQMIWHVGGAADDAPDSTTSVIWP